MIVERGGRFGVLVYDPRVQQKVWVGTYATREEAETHEQLAKAAPHIPGYGEDTCESFARRWPVDFPRPALATKATYRYAAQAHRRHPLPLLERDPRRLRPSRHALPRGEARSRALAWRRSARNKLTAIGLE